MAFSGSLFAMSFLCLTLLCFFYAYCQVAAFSGSTTVSFNGVSAALYTLAANSVNPSSNSLYLLLNAEIPLVTSLAALIPIPILRQPDPDPLRPEEVQYDSIIFLFLNVLAVITGLYLHILLKSSTT